MVFMLHFLYSEYLSYQVSVTEFFLCFMFGSIDKQVEISGCTPLDRTSWLIWPGHK